jgi:hypothetical protein
VAVLVALGKQLVFFSGLSIELPNN